MAIETQLQKNKKSLKDYKPMSYPKDFVIFFLENRLIYDERQYDLVAQEQVYLNLHASLAGNIKLPLFNLIN